MGLPLIASFTSTALFLKEHKQMGSCSRFCLEKGDSSAQADPCTDFGSPWLLLRLPCPTLEGSPYVGQQTCPLGNHPKTQSVNTKFALETCKCDPETAGAAAKQSFSSDLQLQPPLCSLRWQLLLSRSLACKVTALVSGAG